MIAICFSVAAMRSWAEPTIDVLAIDVERNGAKVEISASIRNGVEDLCLSSFQFLSRLSDQGGPEETTLSGLLYQGASPDIPLRHILRIEPGVTVHLTHFFEVDTVSQVVDVPVMGGLPEDEIAELNDSLAKAMRSGRYKSQLEIQSLTCPVHGKFQEVSPGIQFIEMPQQVRRKKTPIVSGSFTFSVSHPE